MEVFSCCCRKGFTTAGQRYIVYVYSLWYCYIHNIVTNTFKLTVLEGERTDQNILSNINVMIVSFLQNKILNGIMVLLY